VILSELHDFQQEKCDSFNFSVESREEADDFGGEGELLAEAVEMMAQLLAAEGGFE
jgi:hypothetical protein